MEALRRGCIFGALALTAAVGCGSDSLVMPDASGDAGVAPDGGPDAGAQDAGLMLPFEVAPPDIPWLDAGTPPIAHPVLTPCPDGWYETELAGETICEPWPAGSYPDCPPGEAQLIGDDGCQPLGGACPAGDFAGDIPADANVVYVLETAAPGGDGSMAAPYPTLAEALAASPSEGTVIALGKGTYEGAVMPPGLTLWGACAADTLVTAPPDAAYALEITGGALELRRLRIEPTDASALVASGADTTTAVRAVEVRGATCHGIDVFDEAVLDGEELVVLGTGSCGPADVRSAGLNAEGATVHVHRSLFANNGHFAIWARVTPEHDTAVELVLEDSVVRDHRDTRSFPHAIWAGHLDREGATTAPVTVAVRRTVIEDNRAGGLDIVGERTVGEVDQILARNNGSLPSVDLYWAAQPVSFFYSSIHLRRSTITGARSNLWWGAVTGGSLGPSTIEDVVIAHNVSKGFWLQYTGAVVYARRVRMSGNLGGDVTLLDATLDLEDAALGAYPARDGTDDAPPYAVAVHTRGAPSHVDLRRVRIEDAAGAGLHIFRYGSTDAGSATLEDVAIKRTRSIVGAGWGIAGGFGASVTAQRILLDGDHTRAIELASGTGSSLNLQDAVIRHTRPYPGEDLGGRGISLASGTGEIRRTRIEGTYELGVAGFASTLTLEDVEVRHTREAACAGRRTCIPHGHALGVYAGSALTAERFIVSDADSCGLHFAQDSEVDLTDGVVTRTRIGACVQVDGYDLDRLQNNVFYPDNDRNLDATELPVPDPGG